MRAFGSRATWTAKDYSDLDLAIVGVSALDCRTLGQLKEAFEQSDLPMRVDVLDWHTITDRFRKVIEQDYVVVQKGPPDMYPGDGTDYVVLVDHTTSNSARRNWLYRPQFPVYWGRMPLYSMARWLNGLAFRDIQFNATGKPIIKIAEIKNGISRQTKFTHQTFDESVHVRSGDLLFSWSGQPETSINAFWWRG